MMVLEEPSIVERTFRKRTVEAQVAGSRAVQSQLAAFMLQRCSKMSKLQTPAPGILPGAGVWTFFDLVRRKLCNRAVRHLPEGDLKIAQPFKLGRQWGRPSPVGTAEFESFPRSLLRRLDVIFLEPDEQEQPWKVYQHQPSLRDLCSAHLNPSSELPGYCLISLREIRKGSRATV